MNSLNDIYLFESYDDSFLTNLNEVYFGRTDSIKAIENQLDIFRRKYIGTKMKPVNDPDLALLNKMITKQFGFKSFSLIIPFDIEPASSTIPVSYNVFADRTDTYIVNTTTYKFKEECNYNCIIVMTTGLIFNNFFSTEEIMACLLRELGYNFYSCLTSGNAILSNIYIASNIAVEISDIVMQFKMSKEYADLISDYLGKDLENKLNDMMSSSDMLNIKKHNPEMYEKAKRNNAKVVASRTKFYNKAVLSILGLDTVLGVFAKTPLFNKLIDKITKSTHKNKSFKKVYYNLGDYLLLAYTKFAGGAVSMIKSFNDSRKIGAKAIKVVDVILKPVHGLIEQAKNPLTWIVLPLNYKVERAADNFATMYGYGPAEVSYLSKMQSKNKIKFVKRILDKVPVLGSVYDILTLPSEIITSVFNSSPTELSAAKDQLNMLKHELSKENLDPVTRDVINKEISELERNISKLIDISKGVDDPDICRKLYLKVLETTMDGIGIKDRLFDNKKKFISYNNNFEFRERRE